MSNVVEIFAKINNVDQIETFIETSSCFIMHVHFSAYGMGFSMFHIDSQEMLFSFCAILMQSSYIWRFVANKALKSLQLLCYYKDMPIQQEIMASYILLQNFRYICSNEVNQRILSCYKFWITRHKTHLEDSFAELLLEKLSWLHLQYCIF